MSKHIMIVHGYLLCGTGSNIYSCNLAMQWKKQGHAITIFCQDPQARYYDWVDEFYGPKDTLPKKAPTAGTVRVLVPDIGGLLPVYVYDDYEGYTVKTIPTCTEEEIDKHISYMAKAIREAVDLWGCDRVLTNHCLLSPVNAARALEGTTIPMDVKVHGSAITFVLKPHPKYMKYAVEAFKASNKIVAGTSHIVNQVKETFKDHVGEIDFDKKLIIVPPGMDPEVFSLCENIRTNTNSFLSEVGKHIEKEGNGRIAAKITFPQVKHADENIHQNLVDIGKTYNQRVADADLLKRFPRIEADEPIIMYFGKFLNTKGVGEILLAFPLIVKKFPTVRLILVGFGGFREHIEAMIYALAAGDVNLFKAAAHSKDELGQSFLESTIDIDKYFRKLEKFEASRITVTGCLNHAELGQLLPIVSVVVVASKANEAFGMVAVEAMSAGVLPLCVYHSGLIDVLEQLKETEPELESVIHLPVESGGDFGATDAAMFMQVFPEKLIEALEFLYPAKDGGFSDDTTRRKVGQRFRAVAEATWSWGGICQKLATL